MKIPDFQNNIPDSIQLNLNRLKTKAGSKEAIAFENLKSPPTECIEGKIENFPLIDFYHCNVILLSLSDKSVRGYKHN